MHITRITKHTLAGILAAATLIPFLAFANPAPKASAATAAPRTTDVPGAQGQMPNTALPATALPATAPPARFGAGNFALATLSGFGGSVIGMVGGGGVIFPVALVTSTGGGFESIGVSWLVLTGLSTITATAGAVYLYGKTAGFRGTYSSTLIGSTLGLAASAGIVAMMSNVQSNTAEATLSSVALLLPALGAVIGYNLSIGSDRGPQRTSGALLDHTPGMGLGFSAPAVSPIMGKQGLIGGHVKLLGGQF